MARCRAAGKCSRLLQRRARLLGSAGQEQRLTQRHEAGIAPLTSGRLRSEHEPGLPFRACDPTDEVRRADDRDHGAEDVMPLASGP